jgi:hypothetical protein
MAEATQIKRFNSARGVVRLVVLEETPETYMVCSPEEYAAAQREGRKPLRVGFRKTDVVK